MQEISRQLKHFFFVWLCVFLRNLTCWNENCFWKEALQEKRSLLGKCWPLIKSDSKIDMIKVLLQPLFCTHENISNQNCVRTKSPVIFFFKCSCLDDNHWWTHELKMTLKIEWLDHLIGFLQKILNFSSRHTQWDYLNYRQLFFVDGSKVSLEVLSIFFSHHQFSQLFTQWFFIWYLYSEWRDGYMIISHTVCENLIFVEIIHFTIDTMTNWIRWQFENVISNVRIANWK